MRWFAQHGFHVTGIDRDASALALACHYGKTIQADIENEPWPLLHNNQPQQFDVVVVTNYLWRALLPTLLLSMAPAGLLLYETFASGNETVGRPANPDFLLHPGELLETCRDMRIIAYEHGFMESPARFVQRIAATKPRCPDCTHYADQKHRLGSR